jgi:hypothetical protein
MDNPDDEGEFVSVNMSLKNWRQAIKNLRTTSAFLEALAELEVRQRSANLEATITDVQDVEEIALTVFVPVSRARAVPFIGRFTNFWTALANTMSAIMRP